MWKFIDQLIADPTSGQSAYRLALEESGFQAKRNLAATGALVRAIYDFGSKSDETSDTIGELLSSDDLETIELIYPILLEDVTLMLKGVGEKKSIVADLTMRANTAEKDAKDVFENYWLTPDSLLWRPAIVSTNLNINWRLLNRIYRRNRKLRKMLYMNPIPSSDPVNKMTRAADEQLVEFAYTLFVSDAKQTYLKPPRRQWWWGLPLLRFGWVEDLWYETMAWEFGRWVDRIFEESGSSRQATLDALSQMLPLPWDESDQYRWPPGYQWDKGSVRRDRRVASVAWGWLTIRGIRLETSEWYRFVGRVSFPFP